MCPTSDPPRCKKACSACVQVHTQASRGFCHSSFHCILNRLERCLIFRIQHCENISIVYYIPHIQTGIRCLELNFMILLYSYEVCKTKAWKWGKIRQFHTKLFDVFRFSLTFGGIANIFSGKFEFYLCWSNIRRSFYVTLKSVFSRTAYPTRL